MKNLRLFLAVLMLLVTFSAMAKKVEIKEARLVGTNYYFERINIHDALPFTSLKITSEYTEQKNGTPLYYVFNINNSGFIMIAADDACYPVLGYSFESTYSPENIPDVVSYWFNKYKDEISFVISGNLQPDNYITTTWEKYSVSELLLPDSPGTVMDVAPLISTLWNQDFPYNAMCPKDDGAGGSYNGRVPVGCVATSMVQIMYYWRYPNTGQGQHCIFPQPGAYGPQCADFGNTTYDWNGMSNQPTKECDPAALVSYQAGVAVDMHYAPSGSGAYMTKVPPAMRNYFKYANSVYYMDRSSSLSTWQTTLRGDLDAKRPLIYSGSGPDGGHAWVCDGYQGSDQFHMNWGWGGSYNGYFTLNSLNPGGSTFNNGQGAVLSIQPDASQYPTYCTGNTNVSTYDFGTIEDGSGPLADYQNSANCSWLIAPDDSISTITLNFERFNLATGDEVKIYDGANASAPLLGTYTGSSLPPATISTGSNLFVTFNSNGSGTAPGWLANFTGSVIPFCASTTIFTAPTGDFTDGSERFSYRNASNCKWKIQPDNAATVTVTFNAFNTETDADKLQVYDLNSGALLGTFSGSSLPPNVTSSSGKMMLIWSTNSSVRGAGWGASYSMTVGTEENENFAALTVFPNPATDKVNISFTLAESQNLKVELVTLSGTRIFSENLTAFRGNYSKTLDVTAYARGIYLLKLISDKGSSVRKIAIQ
jgi:hypothetical protein